MGCKVVTAEVESIDKILYIKEQVQDREGYNPLQQRLIYENEELDDEKTVGDYNIPDGTYLTLLLSLMEQP
jgi:ubiquitin C